MLVPKLAVGMLPIVLYVVGKMIEAGVRENLNDSSMFAAMRAAENKVESLSTQIPNSSLGWRQYF